MIRYTATTVARALLVRTVTRPAKTRLAVERLEARDVPSNVIAGTVYLDANASGTRDGTGVNAVSGVELGPRGPVVLQNGDDTSTGAIPLGFTFNFYGRAFTQAYVNNNGNLTFTGSLSTYSPSGFPQSTPIVAPFWADVDTRGGLGAVHQSVGISPRGRPYFQADWVTVGYFSGGGDKRNDFSVYIEDDPAGDVVAFFYRGMGWTTGSASGGSGGFGGTGAQIGFDSGNGTNFLSFGRPASADDITFLNNARFAFRVGPTGSPEPIQLEAGVAGAVVYLDANGNAARDPGEPTATTTADNAGTATVDEGGRYTFGALPAGTYTVRQELPAGFVGTAPAGGARTVTFTGTGEVSGGQDFGRAQVATLRGRAAEDVNRNGGSDAGDPPLAGVTVFLDANDNGTRDPGERFITTGPSGEYEFGLLPAGPQVVRAVAADGRAVVPPAGARLAVTLTTGETRSGLDFAFATTVPPRVVGVTPTPGAGVASGVSEVAFRFDTDIDPAAFWGGLFELVGAGGDGRFDNGNEVTVPLEFAAWDAATRTMRLTTPGLLPRDAYRLTATDDVVDPLGNRLDGEYVGRFPSGNTAAGGAFVSTFVVSNVPPAAGAFFGTVSQTGSLTVTLAATDPDGTVTGFRVVQAPQHGTLTPTGGLGQFVYTPSAGYAGTDTFRFAATDGLAEGPVAEGRVVVAAAPVDFVPTSLTATAPGGLAVGRPAVFAWAVSNAGPGTTVTGTDWADELYLSDDAFLDPSDVRLDASPVVSPPVGPGGTYTVNRTVTLPFSERSGPAFVLVRANGNRGQLETNTANNVLATPVTLRPTVDVTTSPGSFLGRNQAFPVTWRDADVQGSGTVTIAIDTDADPLNGLGAVVLASALPEDPDGPADRASVTLPAGLASGNYFLWARLDGSAGPVYSVAVPVRVFAEAYQGEDSTRPAVGGGAYEVYGVDLAREGDVFTYRVRTNYDPLSSGGDVYVNVGGSFAGGGGQLSGIAVRPRTTETGQPTTPGALYTGVTFRGGTIRSQHPIYVRGYEGVEGGASAAATATPGQPWRYEINGSFPASAVGAGPDDSVEVGWGMYCGNDFSATDNDKPRRNLLGGGFAVVTRPGSNSATPPRRWGDAVTLDFTVVNQGNEGVGPTTVRFVASPDATIQLSDTGLAVESGSMSIPALAAGQSFSGQVTVRLPAVPPAGFGQVGTIYLGMISDAGNAVAESDEADNLNVRLGTDKAALLLGRPEYVNVLIHGYDPSFSLTYDGMWSSWDGYGEDLLNFAQESGNPELVNNVGVHVTKWRSSEGWNSAFLDVLAVAALGAAKLLPHVRVNPLLVAAADRLQALYLADAVASMVWAGRVARTTATRTVRELLNGTAGQPSLLGGHEEGQWIHVIGHSRGAAVGAEVVRQLDARGYNVAQYTSLDGYSTDWPPPSDALSDIDIVDTLSRGAAEFQVNYLVEQSLLVDFGGAFVADKVGNLLSYLLGEPVVGLVFTQLFLSQFPDWRAPANRAGFDVEPRMGDESSHVRISDQYFDRFRRPPYNPYDTLLEAAARRAGSGLVTAPALGGTGGLTSASGLNTFADGGFDRAGGVRQLLADLGPVPAFDDPLTDTLNRVLGLSGFGISTSLDVTGDYQLIDEGGDWVLQLGQTNDTRFADLLELSPDAESLTFRYAVPAAGPGDELVVTFEGEPVGRFDLAAGAGYQTETLDVARFAGRIGTFAFTLTGPTTDTSVVRLDDLAVIDRPPPPAPPQIGPIADVTTTQGSGAVRVPLPLSDADTPVTALTVQVVWDNKTLVPDGSAFVTQVNGQQFLNVVPAPGALGTARFTVSVSDGSPDVARTTFAVTVAAAAGPPGLRRFATGSGGGGEVALYAPTGAAVFRAVPFPGFTGGVRVATADFSGDGVADLVVGTGPGAPTAVRVFDGVTRAELFAVEPFEPAFTGGVYVAAGDVNGDGVPELVITPDEGGGPRVRVFDGRGFGLLADFFGIDDPQFRGGARAALGDFDGDGAADLVVAAGFGGGPRVAVYDGRSVAGARVKLFNDFFLFEPALRNGAFVAVGDVDGDGFADMVGGGGPGGGPRVLVLAGVDLLAGKAGDSRAIANYFAGDQNNRGGVRVAVKDLDGDRYADLVVGDGAGAGSRVTAYFGEDFAGGSAPDAFGFDAFPGLTEGVYVG